MKNINWKTMIPYLVIVILVIILVFYHNKAQKLEEDLSSENKLRLAMVDTITTYRNQRNELVAEKRTLQFDLKNKEFENDELVKRIKETEKRNATLANKVEVFAAAMVDMQVIIDSLQNSNVYVSEKDTSVTFTSKNPKDIKYTLRVKPVYTIKSRPPQLTFLDFSLPNTQYVEFHWRNNIKEGYPISFSTTNTNPYFVTNNIESYVIPEIRKEDIKPTFWQKVGKGSKSIGEKIIYIGIGVGGTLLLTK